MLHRVKLERFYAVKDSTRPISPHGCRQREQGTLEALSPKHRGPKAKNIHPSGCRIAELVKENHQLKEKLKQAETIIDVQKKLSEILQIPLDPTGEKI